MEKSCYLRPYMLSEILWTSTNVIPQEKFFKFPRQSSSMMSLTARSCFVKNTFIKKKKKIQLAGEQGGTTGSQLTLWSNLIPQLRSCKMSLSEAEKGYLMHKLSHWWHRPYAICGFIQEAKPRRLEWLISTLNQLNKSESTQALMAVSDFQALNNLVIVRDRKELGQDTSGQHHLQGSNSMTRDPHDIPGGFAKCPFIQMTVIFDWIKLSGGECSEVNYSCLPRERICYKRNG